MTKQKEMVLVTKVDIVKPIDIEWNIFGKILRDLQYESFKILNKTMQLAWEYQNFSSNYYKENNKNANHKEILGYNSLSGYIYNKIKEEYKKSNTNNLSQTLKSALDKFNNDKSEILKGNISIPSYKRDCPIDIHNNALKIEKKDEGYIATISLLSNNYKKELELKKGQIEVLLAIPKTKSEKDILQRIVNGEYKTCSSKIIYNKRKKKWTLGIVYKFIPEQKQLDPNKILGVDLGIVNTVAMQVYNRKTGEYERIHYNHQFVDGRELIKFRQKTEKRKRALQKQSKYCGKGRTGRGYKTRNKPALLLGDKIARFRDTFNHKVSKYIIDTAIKYNCGIIQMEDLSGYSSFQEEAFFKDWAYFDLKEKTKYKAKMKGIKVVDIEPAYTSKRCSKCGCIHDENRDGKNNQAKFKCIVCGFEFHADLNAARNIAIPNIENIINEQLEAQRKMKEKK